MRPQQIACEQLKSLLRERVEALLSDNPPQAEAHHVALVVHMSALAYAARYLRSIFADRAANLLEKRIMDMELEEYDLQENESGSLGRTIIGLGIKHVPSGEHDF